MNKFWKLLMGIARFCLEILCKPLKITITDERWMVWEQFIKFVLVGLSNAFVTMLVYTIIITLFGSEYYIIGQTVGYGAGIVNSYLWNSTRVFEGKGTKIFLKMCSCYAATYFLQIGILYVLVNKLHVHDIVSSGMAIIITTPVNFGLNRLWVFRQKNFENEK